MSTSSSRMAPAYLVGTVAQLLGSQYSDKDRAVFSDKQPETFPPGFMTFFDPGWSILRLRDAVAGKKILYPQHWYDNEAFAKFKEEPRYRQLQMEAVRNSFGKTFAEQQTLVPPGQEIPTARVVLMAIAIHFLATRERLFTKHSVRCIDRTSDGDLVDVGQFIPAGLSVAYWPPHNSSVALGIVLARKF